MSALVRVAATAIGAAVLATTAAALPAEAAMVPVSLTLTGPGGNIRSGDDAKMMVKSFQAGTTTPESNVNFLVQERVPGTTAWFSTGQGFTGSDGQRDLWEGPKRHSEFRVVALDDGFHGAAVSNSVIYWVSADLAVEAIQGDVVSQGYDQFIVVWTDAALAGRKVALWRRQGKEWKRVKAGPLSVRYGSARRDFPVSTKVKGKHRYRVTIGASPDLGAAVSKTVTFRVVDP